VVERAPWTFSPYRLGSIEVTNQLFFLRLFLDYPADAAAIGATKGAATVELMAGVVSSDQVTAGSIATRVSKHRGTVFAVPRDVSRVSTPWKGHSTVALSVVSAPQAWSLTRDGHRLTCAVLKRLSGQCIVRLTLNGKHLLDEPCVNCDAGVKRATEALTVFVARGWVDERTVN
jgi:hypothetical protein